MIGLDQLGIALAILGALMLLGSIAKTEYAGGLRSVGSIFFIVGLALALILWLFG